MGEDFRGARRLIENQLMKAARGDADACYELGVVYSSGTAGTAIDMIEAHKWFNLAAMSGSDVAKACRADLAGEMEPGQIAAAQKAARAWLRASGSMGNA